MSTNHNHPEETQPRRAAIFDFEDGEKEQPIEFKDETDTTNHVEKTIKSNKIKKNFTIYGMIALIAIIIAAVIYLWNNDANSDLSDNTPSPTPTVTEPTSNPTETNVEPVEAIINPITNSYPNAPKPKAAEEIATATENNITTSPSNIQLTIQNATIQPAKTECKVTLTTDFCLTGKAIINENTTTDIYFMKDAAHSRIFEKYENFQKQEITGATTAATLDITLSGNKTVLAVVANNSSGYMIVLPDNNPTTIQTVVESITLHQN